MSSDKKIRVAIIGLGFGAEFIPIYQRHPNAEMYAICRRNQKELDAVGDRFGIKTRYTSYDDLLNDPNVDAVHINSPIADHAPQSIAALKAGKHVASTVPAATTIALVTAQAAGFVPTVFSRWIPARSWRGVAGALCFSTGCILPCDTTRGAAADHTDNPKAAGRISRLIQRH